MLAIAAPLLGFAVLGAAPLPGLGPHGGIVGQAGDKQLELVVGPERVALYPLDAQRKVLPLAASDKVTVVCEGRGQLDLLPASDHFEADNPYGVGAPMTCGAVLQGSAGAFAARFAFVPAEASTFHDHRSYHGGVVGMVGDRHLELAAVPEGNRTELQLFVTDAYRQPIALEGLKARARVGDREQVRLDPIAGSFIGHTARSGGPLDVHVEVDFPGEAQPASMDFYVDKTHGPTAAGDGPVEIKVTGGGFVPERIETTAGKSVKLRFVRTSRDTCGKQVVFPALGVTKDLPLDKPVEIDVVVPKGALAFTCGMHMLKGSVVGL